MEGVQPRRGDGAWAEGGTARYRSGGEETDVCYLGIATADDVAAGHPPEVVDALWHGAEHRQGGVAVHFAAMLAWIYGKAAEPFDRERRPLFLRFNTDAADERQTALQDLVARFGAERDAGTSEPGPSPRPPAFPDSAAAPR
jgi:hypothetical protein